MTLTSGLAIFLRFYTRRSGKLLKNLLTITQNQLEIGKLHTFAEFPKTRTHV